MRASVELAHEFTALGKTERAGLVFAQVLSMIQNPKHSISDDVKIVFLLRFAASLAMVGNTEKRQVLYQSPFCLLGFLANWLYSVSLYAEALAVSETAAMEKPQSNSARARARIASLEQGALAAQAFAAIQLSRVRRHTLFLPHTN